MVSTQSVDVQEVEEEMEIMEGNKTMHMECKELHHMENSEQASIQTFGYGSGKSKTRKSSSVGKPRSS